MMQLITRCPKCETAFAFEPDQMRLAEGWVRCGQCAALFEADKYLFERQIEGIQSPSQMGAFAYTHPISEPLVKADKENKFNSTADLGSDLSALKEILGTPFQGEEFGEKIPSTAHFDRLVANNASLDARSALEQMRALSASMQEFSGLSPIKPEKVRADDENLEIENETVEQSHLILILIFCTGLLLVLCQLLWWQRDTIGAISAESHFWVKRICEMVGAQLDWPEDLSGLQILSSSFAQQTDDEYRLKIRLKNQRDYAVKTPEIELTILDDQERALVRKVFTAADLGLLPALTPDRDTVVIVRLLVQGAVTEQMAGYKLDYFYP
jgi:predicted Zn finger-like uncharacterized protein